MTPRERRRGGEGLAGRRGWAAWGGAGLDAGRRVVTVVVPGCPRRSIHGEPARPAWRAMVPLFFVGS